MAIPREDPIPSSPHRPPTCNLWLRYGGGERLQIHGYTVDWALYDALQIALNGRDYDGPDDMGWYCTDDEELEFRIIGAETVLRDKPSLGWVPPEPSLSQLYLAAGKVIEKKEAEPVVQRRRSPSKPRASRDGLVTLAEICGEINITPREARSKLRNKVQKPDAGWAWPKDEVDAIKKLLK